MSIRELFTNRVKMPPNDTKTEVTYPDNGFLRAENKIETTSDIFRAFTKEIS